MLPQLDENILRYISRGGRISQHVGDEAVDPILMRFHALIKLDGIQAESD